MSVLLSAVVAGCDLLPNADDPAPTLTQSMDGRGATFVLDPWSYDHVTAFLCLLQPGDEFTAVHPPDAAAACVPLLVSQEGERMSARFDGVQVPPPMREAFRGSGPPWYLAVSGSRGSSSETLVMSIEASPIPSDAGPS